MTYSTLTIQLYCCKTNNNNTLQVHFCAKLIGSIPFHQEQYGPLSSVLTISATLCKLTIPNQTHPSFDNSVKSLFPEHTYNNPYYKRKRMALEY